MTLCAPPSVAHEKPDLPYLIRVEARGRLVEYQYIGFVRDRLRDADPLLIALR